MADGKLIDAGELIAILTGLIESSGSNAAREIMFAIQARVPSLPDASEPLRARIAELESSQPSEEDMAVLWLIKEKGWLVSFFDGEWLQYGGLLFNPAEEARKLGWGR